MADLESIIADMREYGTAGIDAYLGPHHMALCLKQQANIWADQLAALSHAAGQDGEQCRAASGEVEALERNLVDAMNQIHRLDQARQRWIDRAVKMRRAYREQRDLLRALSRGVPEGKIVAYRLHTPDNRWQWMDGTPPLGTLDLWKSYGWNLEYAYAGPDHDAIAAQRKEGE